MTDITKLFTEGNDVYEVVAPGNYILTFLGGADTLGVSAGTATAAMGDGNDVVTLLAAGSTVSGDAGADRFELWAGATVHGGAQADIFNIRGGAGLTASGDDGNDRFNFAGAAANVLIHGGVGDDDFSGYDVATTGVVYGDGGNDLFTGFRSGVTMRGGAGDDVYRVNAGSSAAVVELAGEGKDTVQLMRGANYTLGANLERVVIGSYAGSDTSSAVIVLNALDNVFVGHGNAETVSGLAGNDRLYGKSGNDVLTGGDGNDLLDGGTSDDVLTGGAGNDMLVGRAGADTMAGEGGNDIYYVDNEFDLVIEAAGGGADVVRSSVATYELSPYVETGIITRTDGAILGGNEQDNLLVGNAGADSLYGGLGNDTLRGGFGADYLSGGAGDDTYFLNYADLIDGETVYETAGGGTDTLRYVDSGLFTMPDNVEIGILSGGSWLWGNDGDNQLFGSSGMDALSGLDGDDILIGGGEADSLAGGYGNDTLDGGTGNDTISADPGADTLTGGAGFDDFLYYQTSDSYTDGADVITDFVVGEDVLDLSWMDADTGVTEDQGFTIVSAFDGGFGRLTVTEDEPGVWGIRGDIDGDSVADFLIIVHSSQALTASDISL